MMKISKFFKRNFKKITPSDHQRKAIVDMGLFNIGHIPEFVHQSESLIRKLRKDPTFNFVSDAQGMAIEIQGIKIRVTNKEEFFILSEVFIDGIYNFQIPNPCVVIDVGMNVGISSLYFASKSNVIGVIGFEPFTPTYLKAKKNLQLNSLISAKIQTHNIGIGSKSEKLRLPYCEEWAGSATITDAPQFFKAGNSFEKQEVLLEPATHIFDDISRKHPDLFKVCKIDCEGSEYLIFDSLLSLPLDMLPDMFMVEWHYRGHQDLVDFFSNHGYLSFVFPAISESVGMIYAVKKDLSFV